MKVATPTSLPTQARIPRVGEYSGSVDFPEALLTYIAAFQGDGSFNKKVGSISFEFRKERKIERLAAALDELGVKYSQNVVRRGATTFYIPKKDALPKMYKTFGPWLLDLKGYCLDFLLDEIEFWDGWRSPQGEVWYFSNRKENCEWIATIAALRNKRARWMSTDTRGINPNYRITVAPNQGKKSTCIPSHVQLKNKIDVACPTIFWFQRYGNNISITGIQS